MKRLAVVLAVLCGLVVLGNAGAWAIRANVAADKIGAKIDSLLGSIDVNRKRIEHSTEGLENGLAELRKANRRRAA